MSGYSILSNQTLFTQTPQLGNFGIIQCMVTASTPIAAVYNGQLNLAEFISQLQNQNQNGGVTFGQINEVYQFNLYKVIKPKIIYSRYTSRVLPDSTQNQQLNTNGYYPSVTFKIDYDSCCVGQMTLLMTTDISVRQDNTPVTVNGYSANGVNQLQIQRSDIQSIQLAYGTDFVYNYIDKISLGFCNTGGGATIWHQEVPSEIAKIYHSIIECPGMSKTIRRMVREDVFTIQHNPYHQYGDFSFALKEDNDLNQYTQLSQQAPPVYTRSAVSSQYQSGFNEIAMYWVDAKIKEINMTKNKYSVYSANQQNWSIGGKPILTDIQVDDQKSQTSKYLTGFNITYISNIQYGTTETTYSLQLPKVVSQGAQLPLGQTAELTPEQFMYIDDKQLTQYGQTMFYTMGINGTYQDFADANLYTINAVKVSDKYNTQIQPVEPISGNGYVNYTLQQSQVSSIPLYITTVGNWADADKRQDIIDKLVGLSQSGTYPTFNITYTLTQGININSQTPSSLIKTVKHQAIFAPFLILDINSQSYQFITALIIKKDSNNAYSAARIGMQVQLTNDGSVANNEMIFTEGRISTLADSVCLLQNSQIADKNLQYINLTVASDHATPATVESTFGFCTINQGFNNIAMSMYQRFYDGQLESTTYITLPGNNVADYDLNGQNTQFFFQGDFTAALTLGTATTDYPIYSYSIQPLSKINQIQNTTLTSPDFFWNAPLFTSFVTEFQTTGDFVNKLNTEIQKIVFNETGAISPYLNTGSFNYINIEIEKYDENDYALNGLSWYYTLNTNGQATFDRRPNPATDQQKYDVYRYNAAMLNNHANEEYNPSLQNVDYQSIHTYRDQQGVVDFYLPLSFLFICQGIRNSFPHYACSAQSIIIKFDFINPLALMDVSIAVNPQAIDKLDFSRNARILVNRANNLTILQNNINNNGFVLFYQRYQWIPEVLDVITEYQYYAWVTKNYERQNKFIQVNQAGNYYELWKYTRSVFYTKIWAFVVSQETLTVMQYNGGFNNILPIQVNKYALPIWDVLTYDFQNTQQANSLSGQELTNYNKLYNSVYSFVPFESVKIETDSSIQMTDEIPYRFQMFNDYVMLDWTQQHSALMFNNLLQFNLDPVYYQEEAPNALYSPAYAPQFKIMYKPKNTMHQVDQYGVILISECVNISYINNHIMLCKYLTNN